MLYRLLTTILLSALILSACGGESKPAQVTEIYLDSLGITMEYSLPWEEYQVQNQDSDDHYLLPTGEDSRRVYLYFGYFPFGLDCEFWDKASTSGKSFAEWVDCIRETEFSPQFNSSVEMEKINGGKVVIITAIDRSSTQEVRKLWALVPGVRHNGEQDVAYIRFMAHPDKYEKYLPDVKRMAKSMKSTR